MLRPKVRLAAWAALGFLAVVFTALQASASPLDDIPEGFGDALGTTTETAKMILAAGGIVGVSIALSVLGAKPTPMLLVLVLMVGVFVAISFLPAWMLVFCAIMIALWFATDIKEVFT